MRPHGVGVLPVGGHDGTGLVDRPEPVQVEALVAHPAVEAFHYRVLGRLARVDKHDLDPMCVRPRVQRLAPELGAIVEVSRSG